MMEQEHSTRGLVDTTVDPIDREYVGDPSEKRVARTFPVTEYVGATHPLFSGPLSYFPDAMLAVAELCKVGNDQHNPGMALHWSRTISTEHLDKAVGHMLKAGTFDDDGVRHLTKTAWRVLAQLQLEIERSVSGGE